MRPFATFLLVLLMAATQSAMAQTVAMRTVAQEGSAPKFMDTEGPATGHCPDILAAIERVDKNLRFSIDPQPTPVKRIEAGLKDGLLDVVCALLDTPMRNEIAFRISTPLFTLQERLVGRRDDNGVIQSVKDLTQTDDLVVTQSGASYAADLRRHGVRVLETPGGSAVALRNVASKRARFYYTNELTGAHYIKAEGLSDQLRLHPGVMQSSLSYLWASRRLDPTTVRLLEQAVAQLKRSGELDRIYQRYQRDH
ncbi:transporter substrate-binding domain-containing protein [Rhodoferax sp. AJA081-3]|uniref:substrate-binding periplasmic protein n=1 Tax=Rhodoferax sp. AJA081-3 TaxID=2752316 RepID=UPI001ADEC509|nr:transporter substrate-binding domain-containing protein [Rhodoferax sp. AJA081-3]QTN27002.1 transporter substrate-binding domain-containing protein [Rhodoferax sp. AJA081-3]